MANIEREVRASAEGLLARREHSCQELTRKLQQRGHSLDVIETVIAALQQEKLLSDARFAETYAYYRSQRGYGPKRIQAELRERGVAAELIGVSLAHLEIDWFALAQQVQQKKFNTGPGEDPKLRAQQQRFLYYRGFDAEQISEVLNE